LVDGVECVEGEEVGGPFWFESEAVECFDDFYCDFGGVAQVLFGGGEGWGVECGCEIVDFG